MSQATMLNTRTVNWMELIGNGKQYRVPLYQRDYSWSQEQWEDLWNDVLEMRSQPDDRHYMGAIVVQALSDRELIIIDGQQRMASLSLLALAVIDKLLKLAESGVELESNTERAKELRNRLIGEKDPASLIEQSRLLLNASNNAFYQDYLVQLRRPLNPRGLLKSNRLLWDCFCYFRRQLDSIPEFNANGRTLAQMLSETVARQLLFILITVDDELNAYTVFETLNARGLELTTTDLLKNYLFSRVQVQADLEALQRRWGALVATVTAERFPEFLRYHLLCEQSRIRSQRLFKLVRAKVKSSQDVFVLLGALEARAELFAALSDPNHGYWVDLHDARPFVRELNLFRVRQMTPVLFSTWEKFEPAEFVRVLKLVSLISFRYTVVSGLNTNELEPVYHQAAKAVLVGEARTVRDVFERLKPIYVDDTKFQSDFTVLTVDTGGQSRKLAKYILARLEADASGRSCDPDTDPASIEHILPENPLDEWEPSFPQEKWESTIYRLGNLTLLEPAANREVGNKSFAEKREAYQTSFYALTRQIPQLAPEQWTLEILEERQRRLATRAIHLWRVDFA